MPASFTTLPQYSTCDLIVTRHRSQACRRRLAADLGESFAYLRRRQHFVGGRIQPRDDIAGRAVLDRKADPLLDHQVGEALLDDRRNILQRFDSLWRRHRQCPQLSRLDEVHDRQAS